MKGDLKRYMLGIKCHHVPDKDIYFIQRKGLMQGINFILALQIYILAVQMYILAAQIYI